MALPKITILVGDGATGRTTQTADGVAGLVLTGVAAAGLALNTPTVIYSLAEAVAKGVTPATHAHAHSQIADFYEKAENGAALWFILVAEATTAAAVFVADTGPMDLLLKAAQGAITIAGTSMGRIAGYTPTVSGLLDFDLAAVGAAAQARALAAYNRFEPVFIILDGTYLVNPLTAPADMRGAGDKVGVFLGASSAGHRKSAMGRLLGCMAANPIHYSVARVKSGYFTPAGYLTSGLGLGSYSAGQIESLHNAGYMAVRSFSGVFGAFVTDDVTLAPQTSDFTSIARRRVMDKAVRIAYGSYVQELGDTIKIRQDGKIHPVSVARIEAVISRALEQQMLSPGNISGYSVYVDPRQNVISTETVTVTVAITPLAYMKQIVVALSFVNPAL